MVTRAAAVKWWRRGAEAGHEGCTAQLESALLADEPLNSTATAETGVLCREAAAPTVAPAAAAGEAGMQPPVSLPAAGGLEVREQTMGQQALDNRLHIPEAMLHDTFSKACKQGHLAVVRELLGLAGDRRVDVHTNGEWAFRQACKQGHVGVVRELLGLSGDRRVDVHASGEAAFQMACWNGHVGVVRELLGLAGDRRVDVHAWQDDAFHGACEQGQLRVVRELLALTGDRVMCTYHPAAAALLAAGPTAPASPADAALWAGVAAADGLMRSGAADGRLVSAARGGYAVRSWGRRRSLVVSRMSRRDFLGGSGGDRRRRCTAERGGE